MNGIIIASYILGGLVSLALLVGAVLVLARRGVVSQANDVILLLQAQVKALQDENAELKAKVGALETQLAVVKDMVTGATAITELREHLDQRLDVIQHAMSQG